jgi:hypothetical protein
MSCGRSSRGWSKDDIGRVAVIVGVPVIQILLLVCVPFKIELPVVLNLKSFEVWIAYD